MRNCLVTKLKENISNSGLQRLGMLKVECLAVENYNPATHRFLVVTSEDSTMYIEGGTFDDGSTSKTLYGGGDYVTVSNDDAVVYIPKYIIQAIVSTDEISSFKFDLDTMGYIGSSQSNSLRMIAKFKGDISNLNEDIDAFNCNGSDASEIYGSISNLNVSDNLAIENCAGVTGELHKIPSNIFIINNCTNLSVNLDIITTEKPEAIQFVGTNAYGPITKCLNLNSSSLFGRGCTNVNGTIESAVENAWGQGRRSGSCNINLLETGVTLHGSVIGDFLTVVFSENNAIIKSWYESTVYATWNGSTWTYNS